MQLSRKFSFFLTSNCFKIEGLLTWSYVTNSRTDANIKQRQTTKKHFNYISNVRISFKQQQSESVFLVRLGMS
jgi:hypothetical protein